MTTGTDGISTCRLLEDLDPFEPASLQPNVEDDERRLPRLDRGPGLRVSAASRVA